MPAHELVDDRLEGVGDRERSRFGRDLGEQDPFEDEVPDLVAERPAIVGVDGVKHLVGFFENERTEGLEGLLAVPGASIRRAQGRNEFDQALEQFGSRGWHRPYATISRAILLTVRRGPRGGTSCRLRGGRRRSWSDEDMTADQPATVTFNTFILSLVTTAAVHFGDIAPPGSDTRMEPNLAGAAQMIEILGMLQQKTRGNLAPEEQQFLEQVLYELRMRYVEATKADKRIIQP
jgi:hypothetical protein